MVAIAKHAHECQVRVWLIQVGEPLPTDEGHPRLFRTGQLAGHLARQGHEVVWWASQFRHSSKSHRSLTRQTACVSSNYRIIYLPSPGYSRNISFARIHDHEVLARQFRVMASHEQAPDVIHCGFPTIELSYEAVRYGQQVGVPVVLDVRDLWPEVFLDAVPHALRRVARAALHWKYGLCRRAFAGAAAITGHAPGFVDFGLNFSKRPRRELDAWFPFAYPASAPSAIEIDEASEFWAALGVGHESRPYTFCFIGAFGEQNTLDLESPVRAARRLEEDGLPVRIVMCGDGPRLSKCRELARGVESVLLPGWVDYPKIWSLMRRSVAGLLPYLPGRDFVMSIPNKAVEYLSASLPIVTSLERGFLHDLVAEAGCGLFYPGGDHAALAATLARIVREPQEIRGMSGAATSLFHEQFKAEVVCERMEAHLLRVVDAWAHERRACR